MDAAFAVFNRDPSASLTQVAELAGVGRATLHRHFSSRDDLLRTLSQIATKQMDDTVQEACSELTSYSKAMRVSLEVLIPLGDRYGFLSLDAVEHDPDLQREFVRQRRETEDMIAGAQSEGLFDPSVPVAWIVQAYEYLLYAGWESVKAGETTRKQASDLAWRTLTSGLGRTAI